VKPVTVCILFILLGRAISVPPVAFADSSFTMLGSHPDSRDKYLKHEQKQQKKALKSQRKAEKRWKKNHHAGH
jgi:hypothetical protein